MSASTSKICTVIPCYNEAARLPVQQFIECLDAHPNYFFLFVNDGSSDTTLNLLSDSFGKHDRVKALNLEKNSGKAEAVRQGMLTAMNWQSFDYIGFMDADLATPLQEIAFLTDQFQSIQAADMVFGSRVKRLGAKIERETIRHYNGRIFATLTSFVLKGIPIYDTQCGAKFFKPSTIPMCFNEVFITRWLFDIEILARIVNQKGKEYALAAVYEAPLRYWKEMGDSKLTLKNMLLAPLELIKIKSKYRL